MFVCSCSGVNLTMMSFHGALKKRPLNTITVVTMMTCQCVTALTLTCWCTSESPSSVSAMNIIKPAVRLIYDVIILAQGNVDL